MSDKKRVWGYAPPEGIPGVDADDLELSWAVVKAGLMDAKEVLDGKVRPEDSKFASLEHARRVMDAAEQIGSAIHEMRMFALWNMTEIVCEGKKKGLNP